MYFIYSLIFVFFTACQTLSVKEDLSTRFFQGQASVSQDNDSFLIPVDVYLDIHHPRLRVDVTGLLGNAVFTALWINSNYTFIFPHKKTYIQMDHHSFKFNEHKDWLWIFSRSVCLYQALLYFSTVDRDEKSLSSDISSLQIRKNIKVKKAIHQTNNTHLITSVKNAENKSHKKNTKNPLKSCQANNVSVTRKNQKQGLSDMQFSFENKNKKITIFLKQKRVMRGAIPSQWFDISIPKSFKKATQLPFYPIQK